jgi:hypothetical protein
MSKPYNSKEWLSLEAAAQYLSSTRGENVSVPDILRLALDGHLTLSVYFAGSVWARNAKKIPAEEASARRAQFADSRNESILVFQAMRSGDIETVELDDEVISIDGVWDLPMIGCEHFDVEFEYQFRTDGPSPSANSAAGAFVEQADGTMCQLQEPLAYLNPRLTAGFISSKHHSAYNPALGLPENGVLVVRREALDDLVRTIEPRA